MLKSRTRHFCWDLATAGKPVISDHYCCCYRGQRAGQGPTRAGPLRLPDWQLVPGTRFVVDKFGGKAYEAAPNSKHWFLTHFHADHYGGLGPRFKQGRAQPCVINITVSSYHVNHIDTIKINVITVMFNAKSAFSKVTLSFVSTRHVTAYLNVFQLHGSNM